MDFTFLTFAALAGSLAAPGLPPVDMTRQDLEQPAVTQTAPAPCDQPSCLVPPAR